jgi:hypothetical protein
MTHQSNLSQSNRDKEDPRCQSCGVSRSGVNYVGLSVRANEMFVSYYESSLGDGRASKILNYEMSGE